MYEDRIGPLKLFKENKTDRTIYIMLYVSTLMGNAWMQPPDQIM